jgi:hypothetical protein
MDVLIDNQAYPLPSGTATLIEALRAVNEALRERRRGVVKFLVDGRPMRPEQLQEEEGKAPISEIGRVEITTADLDAMAMETLDRLEESVSELPTVCRQIADVFRGENPAEALQPFEQMAEIWSYIRDEEVHVASALGVDLAEMEVGGQSLQEASQELNRHLQAAINALGRSKMGVVGDILEHDLAPKAELEAEIVAQLRAEAETRA